jgi:hypothetical protein
LIIEKSSRLFYSANQKGGFIVTIAQLKSIINQLPDETVLLIQADQLDDVATVIVEHHSDNRTHIIFTGLE